MQFYKGFNININIKNIKYILYRLLPILILIGTVLFFQYGYTIEYFFSSSARARMRKAKKKAKKANKKCIDAGYKSCKDKINEDKCKKQGYTSCKDKATQLLCKKEGYDDCKDKNKKKLFETKSKKDTETMIHNAKRIELLGIDIGNRQVYSAPAITI
jgi:hypothetical protein